MQKLLSRQYFIIAVFLQTIFGFPVLRTDMIWHRGSAITENKGFRSRGDGRGRWSKR